MGKYIDLHIHSNYSDGLLSPEQILNKAKHNNLKMISFTDHDTITSQISTYSKYIKEISIVPGVEISSFYNLKKGDKKLIHILGYGIDLNNNKLNNLLCKMKSYRTTINEKYIKDLMDIFHWLPEDIFLNVDCTKYYRLVRSILIYLSNIGIETNLIQDLKKYCRKNLPKYPEYDNSAEKGIESIRAAGGIPVLAHPYEYKMKPIDQKRMIKKLLEYGLEGIEVYHSECPADEMNKLRMMVESYHLLYSCGSDYHFKTPNNNKIIGHGINDNLCFEETTVSNKILEKKLYFGGIR
ncbi:MAG: PHP domain-containing protein [Bacilli bacterium]|nr:PHP domain-containing protein [Bacilli bacterium]